MQDTIAWGWLANPVEKGRANQLLAFSVFSFYNASHRWGLNVGEVENLVSQAGDQGKL